MRIILTLAAIAWVHALVQDVSNWCENYESATGAAAQLSAAVDKNIAGDGKFFSKSSLGWTLNIVNASAGNNNGGATNPDGSYGIVAFPADQNLPDGMCDIEACTATTPTNQECHPRCSPAPDGTEGLWSYSYMMGFSDVVVLTTCTPPPVKYFSYDHIISMRWNDPNNVFYPGQNFGDSVSMSDMEAVTDQIYNKPHVVIASADAHAAELVKQGYINQGFDEKSINIRAIESNTVRMWDRSNGKTVQDSKPDVMFSVMRASIPIGDSMEQIQNWEKLVWPTRFYFAKDETTEPVEPMHPALAPRKSPDVMNEVEVFGPLLKSLRESAVSVLASSDKGFSQVGVTYLDYTTTGFYDDWDAILNNPNNNSFIIPIRDATYGIPVIPEGTDLSIKQDTFAVVSGVIHTETIQTAYSEVSVALENYITGTVLDTIAFEESAALKGSAMRYLDKGSTTYQEAVAAGVDPSLLYAVDIRPPGACNADEAAYCFELSQKVINRKTAAMILGTRTYSVKATGLGPDANTTTTAQLQAFRPAR